MGNVTITTAGGVARVVLERPPLNVVDLDAARELAAAVESLGTGEGLTAVLLAAGAWSRDRRSGAAAS